MYQNRASRIIGLMGFLAQPHMRALRHKMCAGASAITADELLQMEACIRMVLINFEDTAWQARTGLLDSLSQESNRRMTQNVFALPAVRA